MTAPPILMRWPLRYTIPLLLLTFAMVGGGAAFLHERTLERQRIRGDGLQQLRSFASLQARSVRDELLRGDLTGLRAQVANLALDPSVRHARLESPGQVVLASTTLAQIGTRVKTRVVDGIEITLDGTVAQALVPLRAHSLGNGAALGTLIVERDLAPRLLASDRRLTAAFLRYFVYFSVLSLLLWALLERIVWRRLRVLGQVAERLAAGHLELRADEAGGDEIAAIARMGNRAAAQLQSAYADNRRLTRALERLGTAAPGPQLFDELAAAVAAGTGSRWAVIARRGDPPTQLRVVGAAGGAPWTPGMSHPLAGSPLAACVERPDQVCVVERDLGARFPLLVQSHDSPVESMMGVAITAADGSCCGVLAVLCVAACADNATDRALLQTAANRIAHEFARADDDTRLRERDQRLQLAMDVSDVTLTEWDVARDHIDVRGNWLQRFDVQAANGRLRAEDWLAAIHPDDLPPVSAMTTLLRTTGMPTSRIDYRMRARDGSWRWVRARAQVSSSDDAGQPRMVVSVQSDIHDLVATEHELRASENQLRLALEAGELALADWDVVTDRLRVGERWLRSLGYTQEEFGPLRSDLEAIVHLDDRAPVEAHLRAHLRGDSVKASIEFRARRRDGTWCWTRLQAMVTHRDEQGRATRMVGVFADVDVSKRAVEALRERTEFLELAVRGTADGLWDWHPQTDEFYFSPRAHELLGHGDRSLDGKLQDVVARLLSDQEATRLAAEIDAIRGGRDYVDFELSMRTGSGGQRWFRIRGVAVRNVDGSARRVVGSLSDVHDDRVRELELATARQLTSEAIESLDGGMLRLDAEDRIVLINSRYLEMYGLPLTGHYVGMRLRDLVRKHFESHPASLAGRTVEAAIEERMRLHRERMGSWDMQLGDRWILVSDRPTADGGRVCLRTDITSLRALQGALKDRTEYLELVVRGTADGLWSWDRDTGNDLYLSPRVYELLGYEAGQIELPLDRFEATLYHPEDQPRIRAAVTHMLAHPEDGDILSFEGRFLCGNGEYRWFHNRAALVRGANGGLRRFAGSISDVHERRLREREVAEARQQLSDAIEAIDSGLMISDREDRLVLSNRRYREMYEFTPEVAKPGTHIAELARDLMRRHPEYRDGLSVDEAVQKRISKHRAKLDRWELELGNRWYQIGDFETADGGVVSLRTDITHLKHTEQMLRERTEFLEAAVRGSMDGIYDIDLAADRAYFAPRFCELLGYAEGELPASWSAFSAAHFHPDDAAERAAALERIQAGLSDFISREMRLRRRDGSWGWYHGRAAVLRNAEGMPYRLIGSLSDTQAQHEREEELAHARQQLQDAIESLELGLVMFDRDERFVLCNRRFREMYGETGLALEPGVRLEDTLRAHYQAFPEECNGRPLQEIVDQRLEQYRNRRGNFEIPLGRRWIQIANYGTADGGVVSLRNDITAIKRTEQALRESEARLRTVFDNSPVGIFLAGTDGAIVFRNRVFTLLTGIADREWRKHAWLGHVHEEERAWIGARWYEYVAASTGTFDIEYRTADAVERVVRLRAAPVTEQGQVLGFAGTLEDISAQRQAEIDQHRLQMQLQQAQKMDAIGHLTGGIAHDFNNILASILGYAALASERQTTQGDVKLVTYLDAIRQSGERARELVAKMLAFSRSEPREVVTPTVVQPLIAEAVKLLKAIIPSSIHIVTVADPALPSVLVDGVDLHQAVVNLAVNARDAITGHGQITIAVRAPRQIKGHCASCREAIADRYVEIAVSDTGSGIAPEHMSRLFEPFFSTKEVGKGTGMGLSVTHGVIHRVGGHIVVETTPGGGTTVRLLLRSAEPLMKPVPSAPVLPVPSQPRAATVLVVDDEPLVMGLIAEVLEGQGYEVVGYTDSRQALAWARGPEARFDLLVTDQTMPGLTGVELARELLAMRPMLPVVLCTGFSESVDARVAAAMGIRHFFSKPIPLERLVAAVDTLLCDGPAPAVVA